MTIRLPELEPYDISLVLNAIEEVDTLYTYVPSAYILTTATNDNDTITFSCSIIKPTSKHVSSFAIEFVYKNTLFYERVVADDTQEASNVTNTLLLGCICTFIFIRCDKDAAVTDFMSGSGNVLFNFQLASSDASAVTCSNMTIRLTELVLVDTSYQHTVIREIHTVYSYVAASYQLLVNGSAHEVGRGV